MKQYACGSVGGAAFRHNLWIVPETMLSSQAGEADRAWLRSIPFRVIAVDEAHHYANPSSGAFVNEPTSRVTSNSLARLMNWVAC